MGIGKIELPVARKLALSVAALIAPAVRRVEVAGSIRREKPVVGDIELVAIPEDQDKLVKLIQEVGQTIKPGVPGIIPWTPRPGAKYIRARLAEGINLDLFLANPSNWGGLFLMRTGSASGADGNAFNGFVPSVFSRFKKLSGGGRMTDCMPTMPSGEQIVLREEQDFFDLLDMDFVPPVERVDRKAVKRYSRHA